MVGLRRVYKGPFTRHRKLSTSAHPFRSMAGEHIGPLTLDMAASWDQSLTDVGPSGLISQEGKQGNVETRHDDRHEQTIIRQGRLRLDIFLLGFLMLMFIHLQFDRTNLGNALTDGFAAQAGMTQTQINIGQNLFTLAIVLFELPSNVILKSLGAQIWLPFIMLAWGTVTFCQAFVHSRASFYATRFLLATCEAGE